jgi:hypothetical protein
MLCTHEVVCAHTIIYDTGGDFLLAGDGDVLGATGDLAEYFFGIRHGV